MAPELVLTSGCHCQAVAPVQLLSPPRSLSPGGLLSFQLPSASVCILPPPQMDPSGGPAHPRTSRPPPQEESTAPPVRGRPAPPLEPIVTRTLIYSGNYEARWGNHAHVSAWGAEVAPLVPVGGKMNRFVSVGLFEDQHALILPPKRD